MNFFKNSRTYSFGLMLAIAGILLSLVPAGAPTHKQPPSPGVSQADPATPSAATSLATSLAGASKTGERRTGEYGKLPLSFESNQGQTDKTVNFLARGKGYSLFLAPTEATFVLTHQSGAKPQSPEDRLKNDGAKQRKDDDKVSSAAAVLRMQLIGANAAAAANGRQELAGKVNYFIGNDPAKWRTNVSTFGQVRYKEVYPGIDLVYYGNGRQLEYDFVVAPGRDARAIALEFAGAGVKVEAETGDLLLRVGGNTIRQHEPFVYQQIDGRRREVESRYALKEGGRVGFEVGEYDTSASLIIDPVLVYSTYLGGNSTDNGAGIAVDSSGNAYVIGSTISPNFPTKNPFQASLGGNADVFVTKFSADGQSLVYSTYLGGNGDDFPGRIIAVDSSGNAYVTGNTSSTNFPTKNPFQATYGGNVDAFVTKLSADGQSLIYSTYLGSGDNDVGFGIAVDSSANAYVTGFTSSTNFPTKNPFQASLNQTGAAFVTKFSVDGQSLVYSTYLGGSGGAGTGGGAGKAIAVDSSGNAYVAGNTSSMTFPLMNAFQDHNASTPFDVTMGGEQGNFDATVTKFSADGQSLIYSTFLGGDGGDAPSGIAVDSAGSAYVTGSTGSTNFPTKNPFQAKLRGSNSRSAAFITKFSADGRSLIYSTYLGGSVSTFLPVGSDIRDGAAGIAVDSFGNAYVTGGTYATDFPTQNPIQASLGGNRGNVDAFVTKFSADGRSLIYSTYLGGSDNDGGAGIAVDSSGNAYVIGATQSTDFPTKNPFQTKPGPGSDLEAFVTKISDNSTPPPTVQFILTNYSVNKVDGHATITVNRSGDTSGSATVDYRTTDTDTFTLNCADPAKHGSAWGRCDYTTTLGTLTFAAGEALKTFSIPIINDSYADGNETFSVVLSNPTGASLGSPATATVTIINNDTVNGTNPMLLTNDAGIAFFVRQHYLDFLGREPEAGEPWSAILRNCSNQFNTDPASGSAACDRITVSGAFFGSPEFKDKGIYIIDFYRVAFNRLPQYSEFSVDLASITGATAAETNAKRAAFANNFVLRAEFATLAGMSNSTYVTTLMSHMGQYNLTSITTPDPANPDGTTKVTLTTNDLTNRLNGVGGTLTRAQVLRAIVQSDEVTLNFEAVNAFVASQYYGYLRRTPDTNGFNSWVSYLNAHPSDFRTMVNGFMNSTEYRLRFGPP